MNTLMVKFDCKVNEKSAFFFLDAQTSTSEAKEMAFAFLKYLGQIEDAQKAQVPADPVIEQQIVEPVTEQPAEVCNVE